MAAADAAGAAKAAIERVLRAEHEAESSLAQARDQAQAELAQAREEALAIVNQAAERIARWQHRHSERLDARLAAQRAQHADHSDTARAIPDDGVLAAAVARVAAMLTGADDEART